MTGLLGAGALARGARSRGLAPLWLTLMVALLLLAACGSMNVQVDVIDPAYVDTVAHKSQLQGQLSEAFRPAEEKEAKYREIRARLAASLMDEVEAYEREGTDIATASAEALRASIPDILGEFDQLTRNLNALDAEIRQQVAAQRVDAAGADVTAPEISALLMQRQATAEAGVEDVLEMLDENAGAPEGPMPLTGSARRAAAIGALQRSELEADLKSITGGFTLAESSLAYAVASAPEERWAPRYNRTFGRGTFGNLNFAVKMVDLADFTIKGVTFDPSKVAQVASKVTTQSVLLAAQIAGVPVTGLSLRPTDPGAALATQSAGVADVLEANQRFAAREELRQDAVATILTRIAQEERNLRSDEPNVRAEAHRAILATYDAYKALLRMPTS